MDISESDRQTESKYCVIARFNMKLFSIDVVLNVALVVA